METKGRSADDADESPLTDEHRQLRRQIAAALRRARGTRSQPEFRGQMARHLGRAPSANQYSRYETEQVDPPAYVLLAAAQAAGVPLGRLMGEPQPTADTLLQRLQEVDRITERIQHLEDQMEEVAQRASGRGRRPAPEAK